VNYLGAHPQNGDRGKRRLGCISTAAKALWRGRFSSCGPPTSTAASGPEIRLCTARSCFAPQAALCGRRVPRKPCAVRRDYDFFLASGGGRAEAPISARLCIITGSPAKLCERRPGRGSRPLAHRAARILGRVAAAGRAGKCRGGAGSRSGVRKAVGSARPAQAGRSSDCWPESTAKPARAYLRLLRFSSGQCACLGQNWSGWACFRRCRPARKACFR